METGSYPFEISKEIPIDPNTMFVDGHEVKCVRLQVRYTFEIVRPRIVSSFDIATRGRSHVYENVPMGQFGSHQITLVETESPLPAVFVNVLPPSAV